MIKMLKEYIKKHHTNKMTSWCTHENEQIHDIVLLFIDNGLDMESKSGAFED